MAIRRSINLALMAAVSGVFLNLAACNRVGDANAGGGVWGWTTESPTRLCIDENQNRLADAQCDNGRKARFAHWYYLSRGGFVPAVGRYVTGGALTPSAAPGAYKSTDASMKEARAAQRGGFGDLSGASHGDGFLGGLFNDHSDGG